LQSNITNSEARHTKSLDTSIAHLKILAVV
jgi:hypothetical protein